MKVVVAHNRYSSRQPSGENAVVAAEIQMLRQAGVTVIPFLRDSDDIQAMPARARALLPLAPIRAGQAQHQLAALIAAERPDVLHLHNPYPLLSPWVIRTATARDVPVVQTVHNFRHTCVSGVFFRDGRPCHDCLGRRFPAPAIRHGCYRGSRPQSAVMAATLTIHRRTWPKVSRFFALSPVIAGFLAGNGVPAERIVLKPNAVPDPGPPAPPGEGFLFAGRLSAEKGLPLLLEAWSRHPEGTLGPLWIAGDGPLRSALAHLRDDVRYLGSLDSAQVQLAMRRAAVIVVPSRWDEVCPMVAIEAMSQARPVLATNRGGLPWLIGASPDTSGPAAGWLVEPTADALAAGLARAHAEAAGLAAVARTRYQRLFTPEVVTAQLLDTYRCTTV